MKRTVITGNFRQFPDLQAGISTKDGKYDIINPIINELPMGYHEAFILRLPLSNSFWRRQFLFLRGKGADG
ncbi:MAG: hypothetical protein LBT22_05335 [Peptococcaceae bacterium]|jgi:hypothetical protein|nr:hypothetical protein [Peptococcaceae bacterium]